ncbi:hypothetical protein AX768_28755 [Burkholderia sp. PAMC 28687]|nr:hypothetical protein AX768_28755 [Burkholderia sp. PAMC 28687]
MPRVFLNFCGAARTDESPLGQAGFVLDCGAANDTAVVEVGLDVSVGKSATVGISYSGQYGGGYRDNAIQGNVMWRF